MGGQKVPGPHSQTGNPFNVQDGTMARTATPQPGVFLGTGTPTASGATRSLRSKGKAKDSGPTAQQRAQAIAFIRKCINDLRNSSADPTKAELKPLEAFVNHQVQINLGTWQQQVDNAIDVAQAPSQEETRWHFYVALAGNLLWAATCFLNPAAAAMVAGIKVAEKLSKVESAAKVAMKSAKASADMVASQTQLIQIMSVTGAMYGSGTLKEFDPDHSSPTDAKDLIGRMVAIKRGELETHFLRNFTQKWARDLHAIARWEAAGEHPEQYLEVFNKYLWRVMFPTVPFDEKRFLAIRISFQKVVESTLADFDQQWKDFNQRNIWLGGYERKRRNIYFQPKLKIWWEGMLISEPEGFY